MSDPRVRENFDLFREPPLPKERSHAPFQRSSDTSRSAAERIIEGPTFTGNKQAVLKEIAKHPNGVTRKQLAAILFEKQQQYVTGPVAQLIQEGLVYEPPAYDRWNNIMTRVDKSTGQQVVITRKVDNSAVLQLTNKGKAVMGVAA
jgi:hypothetical protein